MANKVQKVQVGFEETKQVLDAMIALGKAIERSLQDGTLNLIDIPNFIAFFTLILPAIESIDEVPFEFQVSNPEQIAELKQYLNDNLDLDDEQLEAFIEDAFKVALDIFAFIKLYFWKQQSSDSTEGSVEPS